MRTLTQSLLAGSVCTAFTASASAVALPAGSVIEFSAQAPGLLPSVTPGHLTDENVSSVAATYDESGERFTFETTLTPDANGNPANSFSLVLGDSVSPIGRTGEFALLYFDATRAGTPVVSLYTYNGASSATSFRFADFQQNAVDGSVAPDTIATSFFDGLAADFLNDASVVVNPDGSRTFSVDIDTTDINAHTPSVASPSGADFFGLQVAQELGIWLHTFEQNFETTYGADGFFVPETGSSNLIATGFAVASNFSTLDLVGLEATVVPEPASVVLTIGGLALLAGRRRGA